MGEEGELHGNGGGGFGAPWRAGPAPRRLAAARARAERGTPDPLALRDPVPGVRKATARALGWLGDARFLEPLGQALRVEQVQAVRHALAGAALRCGASARSVLELEAASHGRRLGSPEGAAPVHQLNGTSPQAAEQAVWAEAGRAEPGPTRDRLGATREAFRLRPRSPVAALRVLAAQAVPLWEEALPGAILLEALGWQGDLAGLPRLRQALSSDRAEARIAAARGLGALGLPDAGPALLALVPEGDTALLQALGELACPAALPPLLAALEHPASAPAAQGALLRLGPLALPALEAALQDPARAGHAAGVLCALSEPHRERLATHPAAPVRTAAWHTDPPPLGALEPVEDDPDALLGLALFQAGRFYEAHEALEEAWRPTSGPRRRFLQALIQGAVSLEHLQRGNPRAARGQWAKTRHKLQQLPARLRGVDLAGWQARFEAFAEQAGLDGTRPTAPLPPRRHWPRPELDPVLAGRLPTPP